MNEQNERPHVDDVLNDYAISEPGPSHTSLVEWIRRYPYYERELTEFTADWTLLTRLPTSTAAQDVEDDVLVLRGMSIVQQLLYAQEQAKAPITPLKGLVQEAAQRGLSFQKLAEHTRMSLSLLRKLDRRLIRFTTIPNQVIVILALVLQRESSVIADYLNGPASLPMDASYHAEQAPTLAEPEDFFEAVRRDMAMPLELREYWLSFSPLNTSNND